LASLPRSATANRGFTLRSPVELGSKQYFHTAVAIGARRAQSRPMMLHILYPRRYLIEARWQAAYPPLLVGGILLGVVIGLAIIIAGRLSRPILELQRQLSRLVEGHFEPVALPARNDELRDLIGSVNRLGDQLDESHRAIKRAERLGLLGQLSGGLAHQLRNSVAGARLAVQLHERHCGDADRDSLAVALRQLTLTESYLKRFLTVGQPSAARRAPLDVRRAVEEVAALLRPACDHHQVELQLDVGPPAQLVLSADADQLRQLLMNLVLNAIEAAGAGGFARVEVADCDAGTVLRVADSGSGIDAQLLDHLFEPFATLKPDGIGLGLAEAKRIVEAHGGTIRYLGGSPTTFEIVLPSAAADEAPVAIERCDAAGAHV
jgi:signal transduction histidine kinase